MPSPSFASYQFVLDILIKGNSFADLGVQRDTLLGIFGTIHSAGVQRLVSTRADGSMRYLDIKAIEVTGDMKVDDGASSLIEATLLGEYPYLQSYISTSQDVLLSNGGGMSIPMGIPLNLSNGAVASVIITNRGNYPAYPMLTFVGSLTTPTLTITQNNVSQAISFSNTLADSTQSMVVDCYNRTVLLQPSGNIGRQYMSGVFLQVPVGRSTIALTSTNGSDTGKATILFNDTFLNI